MFQLSETKDGSHTLINTKLNQSYHSLHGALQESMHVFIREGLLYYLKEFGNTHIHLFEMGYGTGLNAMLAYLESKKSDVKISYTAVELYPIDSKTANALNYAEILSLDPDVAHRFHALDDKCTSMISPNFELTAHFTSLEELEMADSSFDLIFYDAFSPTAQPELWSVDMMKKCFHMLKSPGIWVTYSSKGDVRRALMEVGFAVEKIPGPPGKREMLRALKV